MSTYRKHWDCCDSVTETEAWEPEECPFCSNSDTIKELKKIDDIIWAVADKETGKGDDMFNDGYGLGVGQCSEVIEAAIKRLST